MINKIQRFVKSIFYQEYARASLYYVISNIIGQGIILLSSAIFTRMMSKADYGLISTYSTWVLVINTFICLNVFITARTAYIDIRSDYEGYNSSIMVLCILSGFVVSTIIIGIVVLLGVDITVEEVLLACVQSIGLNMINYMLTVQSMLNEYKKRSFMMIVPNWVHILLSIVLMLIFTQSLYMAKITGNALGIATFGIICMVMLFRKARPKIIPKYWKYALKISIPSIFHTLSDLVLMQCDRLMLTSMVGAEETAEYSVIYNVSSIIVAIYQAINGAWTPWFYRRISERDTENTKKYQGYYMLAFSIFACGMMTISPELIKIISPSNYWHGISYVAPIVMASYLIFLYAFFSSYLLYVKKTGIIAINTIVAAILNLVLNYILIPKYKATGAVIATVMSYLLLFFLHFFSIRKEEKKYFAIKKMFVNTIGVTLYGIFFYFVKDLWIVRYLIFVLVIIMLYLTKGIKIIKEFEKRGIS